MDPVLAQILIAVISAIPPTVAAMAALRMSLKNGRKADLLNKTALGIDEKLDENTVMTATIEKQTNGLVEKLRAEIAALKRQRDAGPGASQ